MIASWQTCSLRLGSRPRCSRTPMSCTGGGNRRPRTGSIDRAKLRPFPRRWFRHADQLHECIVSPHRFCERVRLQWIADHDPAPGRNLLRGCRANQRRHVMAPFKQQRKKPGPQVSSGAGEKDSLSISGLRHGCDSSAGLVRSKPAQPAIPFISSNPFATRRAAAAISAA